MLRVFLDRGDHVARAGKRDHCGRHPGGTGLREGHVAVGEQRLELRFDVIETGSGAVVDFTHSATLALPVVSALLTQRRLVDQSTVFYRSQTIRDRRSAAIGIEVFVGPRVANRSC